MKELDGFLGAALQFAAVDIAIKANLHNALEEAAKRIEASAKAEIGHYQPAAGPFNEWEQLADSTEADKARKGFPSDAPLERTGQFRESWEHETDGLEAVIGSKDERAPWFEFGTPKMPPRPVLGPAVVHNGEFIKKIIGKATVNGLIGGSPIHPDAGYEDIL